MLELQLFERAICIYLFINSVVKPNYLMKLVLETTDENDGDDDEANSVIRSCPAM